MIQIPWLIQSLSIVGAFFCLIAYVSLQFHYMDSKKMIYNFLNVLGSGILMYIAIQPFQAGFFIMESVWFLASLAGCVKAFYGRRRIHEKRKKFF